MESPDFPQKFIRLTSGLDAESCETVIRCLSRIRQALGTKKAWLDLYTQEEQEKLRLLRDSFHSEIIQVSDSLFAWRSFLLPIRHFEASVFYYRHGLPLLRHPERAEGRARGGESAVVSLQSAAAYSRKSAALAQATPRPHYERKAFN